MRESKKARKVRAREIHERLVERHPDAHCELDHRNPYELTVATILSAQCTDRRVNEVTPALFTRFPDAEALAGAALEEVEGLVHSTGFYRNKAKNLIGMAEAVTDRHGGEIPRTMSELTALPGIGRKTANVVLGNAFDIHVGVVVDTHVGRLARRLRLTREEDPVKVEKELMELFPQEHWTQLAHLLIFHGRRVCLARRPRCAECTLVDLCPSAMVPTGSRTPASPRSGPASA